jgi:hypothetical protein
MPAVAGAASCNGGGHTLSLSNGSVSPGAGSGSTSFLFAVTYRDTGNCAPDLVTLQVAGLGTYPLSTSGTSYATGVVYSRTLQIDKPGTYGYTFTATSGSKQATLRGVRPATFQVSAPAPPPPTPKPTPPPTPKPTAPPTPVPKPTAPSTPPPTAAPRPPSVAPSAAVPTPASTSDGSPSATPLPPSQSASAAASASASGTTPSPPIAGGGGGDGSPPTKGGTSSSHGGPSDGFIRFATWAVVTTAGLWLLLVLSRRSRPAESGLTAGPLRPAHAASTTSAGQAAGTARPSREEADMPRWLRPSVRAARRRGARD